MHLFSTMSCLMFCILEHSISNRLYWFVNKPVLLIYQKTFSLNNFALFFLYLCLLQINCEYKKQLSAKVEYAQ